VGGSDKTSVTGNTITKSGRNGVYVRTGNNTLVNNTIDANGNTTDKTGSGVALSPETATAPAAADLVLPGKTESLAATVTDLASDADAASALSGNVLRGNTIKNNVDDGVELKGAASTTIDSNTISTNGVVGIYLSDGTSDSVITKNTITANGRYGIQATGSDVQRNRWSENAIFDNVGTTGTGTTNQYPGIVVTGGANNSIAAPVVTGVQGQTVRGTALAGATVEIFTDAGTQGRFFEGRATAQADGTWSFTATRPWQAANITATATDTTNNSSVFSKPIAQNAPALSQKVYVPMVQR
jgi:parallel beta-helix repeat protein